jgi:hypothetical protein
MRRREFIAGLGGAAVALPLAAQAQQPALPVVGLRTPEAAEPLTAAFRGGLAETGFVEGRNVAIEYRYAGGNFDALPPDCQQKPLLLRSRLFSWAAATPSRPGLSRASIAPAVTSPA